MSELIWKPVVGFEGLYEVSNTGRVRSLDRMIEDTQGVKRNLTGIELVCISQQKRKAGLCVTLCDVERKLRLQVARLVYEAFVHRVEDGPMPKRVRHFDDNVNNNHWTNLYGVSKDHDKV
jgi:hypothetical protein